MIGGPARDLGNVLLAQQLGGSVRCIGGIVGIGLRISGVSLLLRGRCE